MAAEARLEAHCCRYATARGTIAIKQRGGPAGTPDRLYVLPNGRVWWVEFKALKGRVSARQTVMRVQLQKNGQRVDVIRDFDQFRLMYDELAKK